MKLNLEEIRLTKGRRVYNQLRPFEYPVGEVDVSWLHKTLNIEDAVSCLSVAGYEERCLFLCSVVRLCDSIYLPDHKHLKYTINLIEMFITRDGSPKNLDGLRNKLTAICSKHKCLATDENYKFFNAIRALMYLSYRVPDADHSSPYNICMYTANATEDPSKTWNRINALFYEHFVEEQE